MAVVYEQQSWPKAPSEDEPDRVQVPMPFKLVPYRAHLSGGSALPWRKYNKKKAFPRITRIGLSITHELTIRVKFSILGCVING